MVQGLLNVYIAKSDKTEISVFKLAMLTAARDCGVDHLDRFSAFPANRISTLLKWPCPVG